VYFTAVAFVSAALKDLFFLLQITDQTTKNSRCDGMTVFAVLLSWSKSQNRWQLLTKFAFFG